MLGQVDLDKLVEKHLDSVQDWERNFKALKARGKDSESLPRFVSRLTNRVTAASSEQLQRAFSQVVAKKNIIKLDNKKLDLTAHLCFLYCASNN